ncbi:response regulator transcription factor [Rheinheimera maricola]|uniref:Response regulator n=1 Tax=Rheinheimera maricola TaxID=2793282 RepID=A0ABS7X9S1_9GAMM|nr:response regulator transcription factor [Rheinheimera maricola]MBZ9612304.1 hypothetical protein [Rheinheimera maricola]
MDWIIENKEWLFSGIGATIVAFILARMFSEKKDETIRQPQTNNIGLEINNFGNSPNSDKRLKITDDKNYNEKKKKTLDEFKNETRILFIDDDTRFKVSKILIKSGWVHTKLIKDCETLDDIDIVNASILFIDVQGVGLAMGFNDEGLGLALAIKQKYPNKKVVIYSAETQGDRFHKALRAADSFLAKNADPYEFQRLVEDFTVGLEC